MSSSPGSRVVSAIGAEYSRYKTLAEGAMDQLTEAQLNAAATSGDNSVVVICWHVSGNLRSRFTEFLTTDGEKPWRHREEEFDARNVTHDVLVATWTDGWNVLFGALSLLSDDDLSRTVTIRSELLTVYDALLRSLTHVSYHVGQIVYLAKTMRGDDWRSLTIPRGQSDAFNKAMQAQRNSS